MVDHRSTGLAECGPTESSAPEPCSLGDASVKPTKFKIIRESKAFFVIKLCTKSV